MGCGSSKDKPDGPSGSNDKKQDGQQPEKVRVVYRQAYPQATYQVAPAAQPGTGQPGQQVTYVQQPTRVVYAAPPFGGYGGYGGYGYHHHHDDLLLGMAIGGGLGYGYGWDCW